MREKSGWFLRPLNMIINVRMAQGKTSIKTVSHYEKVLKACDIVWLVSSACNLKRHWPESAVVRRPD